jgi:hypothetical protein
MLTYPLSPNLIAGDATVAQTIAFLKSPTQLARRLSDILSAENFLAHVILQQRYTIQGGVIAYFEDETVLADGDPETVSPGGDYPTIPVSEDQAKLLAAGKTGFGTVVTDEAVGREAIAPVDRALGKLANKLIATFDTNTVTQIQSKVPATTTTAWADGLSVLKALAKAKAQIKSLKKGFLATSLVLTELQYAQLLPLVLDYLPREGGNPAASGDFPQLLGVTFLHSEFLPDNWAPTVIDATNLGGIAHEAIPSPEFSTVPTAVNADASNVEVARERDGNDATKIRVRKADIPVVRNPTAGLQLTGTGL